ncbi:MAG: hypothetical protein LBU90_04705 [Bacteroidales bacterium]|jgi:hypothetical protein|nr:hypothetical protein [Bacteroidales bacterium]
MNKHYTFFRSFAAAGIMVISGILNGYGQDSRCLCIPNNDADYVLPSNCTEYTNGTNPIYGVRCATQGGDISLAYLQDNATLHLTNPNVTYTITTGGNYHASVYIHEGVNVIISFATLNKIYLFNRGTITRTGNLGINGGGSIANSGIMNISGQFGNIDGDFTNQGKLSCGQFGSIQGQNDPMCMGNGSIVTTKKFGDINGKFGNVKGGGTIFVTESFGNFNATNTFDVADELTICIAPGVSLPSQAPNTTSPRWGKAKLMLNCTNANAGCDFFPTISPTTFTVGNSTTFTAGGVPSGATIYWLINDNPVDGENGTTFTHTPALTDRIAFAVYKGDCKKMSNGVTMSQTHFDPKVSIDWMDGEETITGTNSSSITVCTVDNAINLRATPQYAGLFPQYKWTSSKGKDSGPLSSDKRNCPFTSFVDGEVVTVTMLADIGLSGDACNSVAANEITASLTITVGSGGNIEAVLNPLPSFCSTSAAAIDLSQYAASLSAPLSGAFSGNGVSGTTFSPSTAGVGTHVITYTVTNEDSKCSGSTTESITVANIANPALSVSFSETDISQVILTATLASIDYATGVQFQYRAKGSTQWTNIGSVQTIAGTQYTATQSLAKGSYEFRAVLSTSLACEVSSAIKTGIIRCVNCK